ncbi:MAG: hypothetical protein IPJ94_27970 [Chloroflexi bacterium]|nr:hypothetical protein [Chloroflexota bacterium]
MYLYKNIGDGRIVPWCSIAEILTDRPVIALSEISWPPLGIIFCSSNDERFLNMEDVTKWGKYEFRDKVDLSLHLPLLQANTDHPIAFGSIETIEKWRKESGVLWAVAQSENLASEISVAMT